MCIYIFYVHIYKQYVSYLLHVPEILQCVKHSIHDKFRVTERLLKHHLPASNHGVKHQHFMPMNKRDHCFPNITS